MADAASVISAICSGVAVIITAAGGAYLAVRQGRSIKQAQELKADHERNARDTGQRLLTVIDKVNTLDARTDAVQRQVERVPTTSQWAFRMGVTPPVPMPAPSPGVTVRLGPTPPHIPPLDPEEK